ncbi:MAG: 4Fe-4S dicluster domain-containing protein [Candidatus Omnitrophota bacterium]|jgi:2-oxoglutarate ferredoxin oxidoreductase subunit delta
MTSSFKVSINKDKCKGCQLCVYFCPAKHLKTSSDLNKRGVKYVTKKEASRCSGCGFCFLVCPDCCIEIYTEDKVQTTDDR